MMSKNSLADFKEQQLIKLLCSYGRFTIVPIKDSFWVADLDFHPFIASPIRAICSDKLGAIRRVEFLVKDMMEIQSHEIQKKS